MTPETPNQTTPSQKAALSYSQQAEFFGQPLTPQYVRQEVALQKLDARIADHITQAGLGEVQPLEVWRWRQAGSHQYEWRRDDYFASRYWDAQDVGARECGPEGRSISLLNLLTIYLAGILTTLCVFGTAHFFPHFLGGR